MRLDRKLLLIAPSIVLFFVVAGIVYTASQLHVLSATVAWKDGRDLVASVERGQRTLDQRQALNIVQYALDVEERRTAAIAAIRDLLLWLAGMAFVSLVALAIGIRGVRREHWPRFTATGHAEPS